MAYFGIIDAANPFNRVTVQASNDGNLFSYDDLTAGFARPAAQVIPEPGTLALLPRGIASRRAGAGFSRSPIPRGSLFKCRRFVIMGAVTPSGRRKKTNYDHRPEAHQPPIYRTEVCLDSRSLFWG